ncbi:aspartate aminotransferase family protein [Pedobacter jamesrossensis]|uniref:DegT/DnrJ/EryC1/StrS aminotransferase family protein n=2 Tax=Pedobacter jamesrossensis TaxID=1908238 RepID=A0ABV8NKH7_9SPHI
MSAKDAIFRALSFYNLHNEDEVYIVTTSRNKYVSSCVTSQIDRCCKWTREISDRTKLIFVIHEFGTLCNVEELSKFNIPIIEDFAMSMFSQVSSKKSDLSDFKIYSLPKFFPVQFGGVLCYGNNKFQTKKIENLLDFQKYLQKISTHYLLQENFIISKRKENYSYYKEKLTELNLKCRFELSEYETPSVFMFTSKNIDLDGLKIFCQSHGIECSKFYGESSFFLPVHQYLDEFDINYIVNLIKYFINENE